MIEKKSRYLSKLLRHNPEDLHMNNSGFVSVSAILNKLKISKSELDQIVNDNNKKRFEYNRDETKIRARQGHSFEVDIDSIKKVKLNDSAPLKLYHGTSQELCYHILNTGLKPMSRLHVHLSIDIETAKSVAYRKSKDIVVFEIDCTELIKKEKLFLSANNVYLTDYVEPKLIKIYAKY